MEAGSFGSRRLAKEFRELETELLKQGRFYDSVKLGIEDLHSVASNKYDEGIREMLKNIKKLDLR